MRFVSRWSMVRILLVVASLLVAVSAAKASRLDIKAVIKRIIPKVSQQLSEVAVGGKVAITAACVATACLVNFAMPADALDTSTLYSEAELLSRDGASGFFPARVDKSAADSSGIDFSYWAAKGIYHSSGNNLGTVRLGVNAKMKNFSAYLTSAFRYHHDNVNHIDDIGLKTRSYAGFNGILINNGEGNLSFGYTNVVSYGGSSKLTLRGIENYLLHYHQGHFQIAAVGHEYIDTDGSNLSDDTDEVRSHGLAVYRAGLNYPVADLFTSNDVIDIRLKLNSAVHLGDIGPVKLGETWQGELNDWAGDAANLDHLLYHRAGGSINMTFADDRIKLSFGGALQHTVGGDIKADTHEQGEFDIVRTTLAVSGSIKLIPQHDVALKGYFKRYDQSVEASLGSESYDDDAWGTASRIVLIKKF